MRCISTFIRIPKFHEIDTSMIYMRLWRDAPEITVTAPKIDHKTAEIESFVFTQETDLAEGRWGIREPVSKVVAAPIEIDLVIVPMLCFDADGHRVGYGKGFYDRFMHKLRPDCQKVGVSYWPPVSEKIPTHDGDISLDLCLTPDETYIINEIRSLPDQ